MANEHIRDLQFEHSRKNVESSFSHNSINNSSKQFLSLLIICELNAKQLLFNFCRVVSDRANALTLKILHIHELQA